MQQQELYLRRGRDSTRKDEPKGVLFLDRSHFQCYSACWDFPTRQN